MGKTTTRRSVSIRGITYQRLKNYCASKGISISGFLEEIIADKMEKAGQAVPTAVEPKPGRVAKVQVEREEKRVETQASNHFSF